MVNYNIDTEDESFFSNELDEQTLNFKELDDKFSQFESFINEGNLNESNNSASSNLSELFKLISTSEAKPLLGRGSFNGKEKAKSAFNRFIKSV